MKQRVVTALLLAPIAIATILFLPTAVVAVITAAIALFTLWEITRLLGMRSSVVRLLPLLVASAIMLLLWWLPNPTAWWVTIGIGVLWWFLVMVWLRHASFGAAPTHGNRLLKLIAGLVTVIPAWLALLELHRSLPHGHAWALFALMLVWGADVFAFLVGRRWGTTKLAPRISPNKTHAGVVGALAGSAVVAIIGGALLGARGWVLVAIIGVAMLAVGASVFGDLFESLLKRQANVKDSGNLFPGHGGLYDRTDSLFAALPFFVVGKALIDLFQP